MHWLVTLDYGNRCEYYPVHSSKFAADLIANNWRSIAKIRGDKIKITVEEVVPDVVRRFSAKGV